MTWCVSVSEPSNVISILISSEFLKMDTLVSVYTEVKTWNKMMMMMIPAKKRDAVRVHVVLQYFQIIE